MPTAPTFWPERAVVRLAVLAQVRSTEAGCAACDADMLRWILTTPLLRQAVEQGGPARALSVNAIAQSMDLSYETTRRQLRRMIDGGACVRGPDGVRLSAESWLAATGLIDALGRNMRSLLGNLLLLGIDLPRPARSGAGRTGGIDRALVLLALDLNLLGMESWHRLTPNALDMRLLGAITVENCRAFTADPVLCLRYGEWDMPPPEGLKRPIAVRPLARRLRIPYATAWRSAQRLLGSGTVAVMEGGLVTMNAPLDARYLEQRRRTSTYLRQHLSRLAAEGIDLHALAAEDVRMRGGDDPYGVEVAPARGAGLRQPGPSDA